MPALVPVVDSLDSVPEAARSFYEQAANGKFQLSLSAAPSGFATAADLAAANGKVVEFRDNNVKLMKEVEELRTLREQYKDLDPAAARDALAKLGEFEKKGAKTPDDLAAKIQEAIKAAVAPLQQEILSTKQIAEQERKRANEATMRTLIGEQFVRAGGLPKATDFILQKAEDAFEVRDGRVVAKANRFSTEKPGELLGVDEWLVQASKEHDFAFAPSRGGGSAGSGSGTSSGGRPGQTVLRNPTPQQLGEFGQDISKGKVRIEYTQ